MNPWTGHKPPARSARLSFIAALLLSAVMLRADQPLRTSLVEQARSADCILYGKVLSGQSRMEFGRIYTYYELSGIQTVKGPATPHTVVRVPGGVVGVVAYIVPGAPEFLEREQVVLFLKDHGGGVFDLDGLATPVYRVRPDEQGEPEVLQNVELGSPVLAADGHVYPPEKPMTLEAFLGAVSSYLGRKYEPLPVKAFPLEGLAVGTKKTKAGRGAPDLSAGNVQAGYSRILDRPVDIFWDLSRDYGPIKGGQVFWYFDPDSIAGKSPYGVTPDQALLALQWSFGQWNAIPTSRLVYKYAGSRRDNPNHKLDLVNMVTFADSEYIYGAQKDAIASARPFVITRRTWVGPEGLDYDLDGKIDFPNFPQGIWEAGTIIDCDLRWDVGGPYADVDFAVDSVPGALSMQGVFNHEIGHMGGLVHSPIRDLGNLLAGVNHTPTMFSVALPNPANGAGNPMLSLENDDMVSLSMLYPTADFGSSYGTIEGTAVKGTDGTPARGNFVVALSADGAPYKNMNDAYHRAATAIGVFSDQFGHFRIPGLPPGRYIVGLQPMDDEPTGTNRNAFNTLVSRFGDVDFIWDEFYNGPREGSREDDPFDYEPVTVTAGGTASGINFVTNFYPSGRERLRRLFGDADFYIAVNQLRGSAVSSTSDMAGRKFPQAFQVPYHIVGATCDFAAFTAPPQGAQVVWPEIILTVSDPANPTRPDLAHPIATLKDFAGDGTLLSTDPLPFQYPLTVDRPGQLWLVVRSPSGKFNTYHNIDILGAGQDELQVDESFISLNGGGSWLSVMGFGISWRMGVDLEGTTELEPLAEPKLVLGESLASGGGIRLNFAAPRSLSGASPENPVTLSLRYRYTAQPYPAASLIAGAVPAQDGSLGFELSRAGEHGDSVLYRVSGLKLSGDRLEGNLEKLSGTDPVGGALNLGRLSGRPGAGFEGLWEGSFGSVGTVRLDLRGNGTGLGGALIWPVVTLPVADSLLVFRGRPGDTLITVDSLPSNPAGFELSAYDDAGRSSLPAVLGLGWDRFEPNERIKDARPLAPSLAWPVQRHELSAIRGVIASSKDFTDIDFFRFPVARGDSVVIDVDAVSARPFLPVSSLDAYFSAYDSTGASFRGADGREVLSDDENGLDPFYAFVSPRDATLYLKLQEAATAYGDPPSLTGYNAFYELRVSLLPRRGDVVRDGVIRIDDVLAALDAASNNAATDPQSLFAADINGDGKVDMTDAARVFRLALDNPLKASTATLASADPPGGLDLSLATAMGGLTLRAGVFGGAPALLWLEFSGRIDAVRPGQDFPDGAELLASRTGGDWQVLLDLSGGRTAFRGGELLRLDTQFAGGCNLVRATAGSPGAGESLVSVAGDLSRGADLPQEFHLGNNFPNPFNPSTTIVYRVPEGNTSEVRLEVFDLRGRRVRSLIRGNREPGEYRVVWDGTDGSGQPLASGVYFCRMSAESFSSVRKMVLLR